MLGRSVLALVGAAWLVAQTVAEPQAPTAEQDIVDGLAGDDVCEAGGGENGACGVELRQLRAQESAATASRHEQAGAEAGGKSGTEAEAGGAAQEASFGPDAQGTGMWGGTTWDDILLSIQANTSSDGSCQEDTYGTCSVFSCAESRGATKCSGGKCVCASGYCAKSGTCYPQAGQCVTDSGGSCSVLSCKSSRGATKCKSGKCLCKTGGCAWKGKCYPIADTGGSCSLLSCGASRGPTTCHRGRCLCKDGYVAVSGRCELLM